MAPLILPLLGALLASPPPNWQVVPAPEGHGVERVAWSADGGRLAVCGSDAVSVQEAPVKQTIVAQHGCQDIVFDGADVIYAVRDQRHAGVWRTSKAGLKRLTTEPARAVLLRDGRLWTAGRDLTIRQGSAIVARAPLPGIRRLIATAAGVLAVTAKDVRLLDAQGQVRQTFTPTPAPSPNGLYDAVTLPEGRVAAVDNGGSVWIWDAKGAALGHGQSIGNANWLVWTGVALVVGDTWLQLDPLRPVTRITRQPRSVGPAAVSPDGTRIAIPLHQGVLLRPATAKAELPRGMPATTRGIVVAPDAVWMADDDGHLLQFDRQGKPKAMHAIATSQLRGLVGDPAKTLYAGTEWGHVIAWRPTGPYRRWTNRDVEHLALTADGGTLYVGGQKTADAFDTRTGARTPMVEADDDYSPFHPVVTPTGGVVWFRGGHPAVWHARGKAPVKILSGRGGGFDRRGRLWVNGRAAKPGIYGWPKRNKIKALPAFNEGRFFPLADGGMVVTGWGGRVRALNADGTERWSAHAPWHVGGAAVLPDAVRGDRLLTGGPDLAVQSWDLKTGVRTDWAPPGRGQRVSGMAFSADGRLLAVGADSTGLRVWDLQTHRMVRDLAVPDGEVRVSRADKEWLIHQYDTVQRWPVAGGRARPVKLTEAYDSISSSTPQPGGAYALRAREAHTDIVDLRTGKALWSVKVPDSVRTVVMSADGQRVAMLVPGAQMDLRVHVRGAPVRAGIKGAFNDLAWHGESLLVWSEEAAFEWTPKGLRARPDLPTFSSRVAQAGHRIALSDGKVVRVQDGAKVVRALPVERHGGQHLRLSPDGAVLAVGGTFTGSVVLWSVETGEAIARYEAFADGLWRSTTADGVVATGKTISRQR